MPHHIPLIKHTLRRHGDGMLFQLPDIRTALHSAQHIVRISLGIAVIALHHISKAVLCRLLLRRKAAAVDNACGVYTLTVLVIDFQRGVVIFRFHHQIEFLGIQVSFYGVAPSGIRDLQKL